MLPFLPPKRVRGLSVGPLVKPRCLSKGLDPLPGTRLFVQENPCLRCSLPSADLTVHPPFLPDAV